MAFVKIHVFFFFFFFGIVDISMFIYDKTKKVIHYSLLNSIGLCKKIKLIQLSIKLLYKKKNK